MKNIVIINAYGSKNIGDSAILQVARELIEEILIEKSNIYILAEDPSSIDTKSRFGNKIIPLHLPYGYAIDSQNEKLSYHGKLLRFIIIYIQSCYFILSGELNPALLPKNGFYSFINQIKNSDVIIGMGGGYFNSRSKYKDYFGLLITLLPVYISKFYKKRILFLPMSFGSFASSLQENLTYRALKGTELICRDKMSFDRISKIDKNNKIKKLLLPDLALFFRIKKSQNKKYDYKYIVLTGREWLNKKDQDQYEKALANFIDYIAETHNLKTIFIPMAYNPIEDDDNRTAKRISVYLKNKKNLLILSEKSPTEVQNILKYAYLAICTRLHSAILATTVNTPFITIAYGTKTQGYLEMFGLENWNIEIEKLTFEDLVENFEKLIDKQKMETFKKILSKKFSTFSLHRGSLIKEITQTIYK